jgi:hypothetical protein
MKNWILIVLAILGSFICGYFFKKIFTGSKAKTVAVQQTVKTDTTKTKSSMKLGAFSISLSVKDLNISKEFYEGMGFTVFAGSMKQNYLIMKNENALVEGCSKACFRAIYSPSTPAGTRTPKTLKSLTMCVKYNAS